MKRLATRPDPPGMAPLAERRPARPETDPVRVGISTCLLGEPVRFDGGHKHDQYVVGTLG